MAPSPEYDKEPKAPDKKVAGSTDNDIKTSLSAVSEQINSDNKALATAADVETEESEHAESMEEGQWRALLDEAIPYNKCPKDRDGKANNLFKQNKHIETLDDGQLRALLDEAITYKSPKDRAGKSQLFKELLEKVEQDEQACEAAGAEGGRGWNSSRSRNARGLNSCGSNSLQDLVAAALAAEAPPRRRHAAVSARTHHGGSLPSGVDRSFLLSEEPMRTGTGGGASSVSGSSSGSGSGGGCGTGGGHEYVATVRCVNPTPLGERRVSASDAHNATEMELLNRRSKMPMFPMYTARTTLEIGSGSVCSGRAVTTTTASNQVRTRPRRHAPAAPHATPTCGPPERLYLPHKNGNNQQKLMNALYTRAPCTPRPHINARTNGGGRLSHSVHTDRRNPLPNDPLTDTRELADNRSGRKPRGPGGQHKYDANQYTDTNAYAQETFVKTKKYNVEAYCKRKCKEDSMKTKNIKHTKYYDIDNGQNVQSTQPVVPTSRSKPSRVESGGARVCQYSEKYTFHSTNISSNPQTSRENVNKKEMANFVFGEPNLDPLLQIEDISHSSNELVKLLI